MALCQCTVRNSDSDMEGCTFTGAGLRVFLYWSNGKEHYVSFTQNVTTAEEICIHVAQRLGKGHGMVGNCKCSRIRG
ncbi:unnamed protein product [Ranitomeya imitator]|uniref:FERM F1 lobe ubiquitin-like domain-containing protein n=1 Tax=Ranitomeya imitator TaxID=111125 RepID=A0ABN9LJF5_9NEOB|nr:unnamed protein product [Ranitomeya imitator]